MPECTILVGVPGSGKSTWIYNNFSISGDVVSSDNIIEEIAEEWGYSYDEIFKDVIGFADRVFWDQIKNWSNERFDLIIDRTNMSVKSRRKYFDILLPKGYTFHAVVFPTPEEVEWKRRLASRPGKTIPQDILNSMQKSFVMPTTEEGFSSVTMYKEL